MEKTTDNRHGWVLQSRSWSLNFEDDDQSYVQGMNHSTGKHISTTHDHKT